MGAKPGEVLRVAASPYAREQFRAYKTRAKASPGTIHEKIWEQLRELVRTHLTKLDVALAREAQLSGDMANVFRIKMGRLRIFYLASSSIARVVVLFVGYRKEGDANDAYAAAARMIHGGQFDHQFTELGVAKPSR